MLELSESNIHLNATATNKLQAIEMAASALEQAGNVEQGYLQGMLGREQQTSTFLGNGIAIPHGTLETRSMVKKTGVQVFQFPQGIEWGEGNVAYVVIGIAARSDEHLALLRQLTHVLGDEDTAAQLTTLTDVEKFRAILLGESDSFSITEETLSLDIETQSLLTLTAINAGKLQQQSAVENSFVSEVVSNSALPLGKGLWVTDAVSGNVKNALAFSRAKTIFNHNGKAVKGVLTISAVNDQINETLARLLDDEVQNILLSGNTQQILTALATYHEQHNDQLGLSKARLYRIATLNQPENLIYHFIEEMLDEGQLQQTRGWLHLPSHKIQFSAEEQSLWQAVLAEFEKAHGQAIWVRDMATALAQDESVMRNFMYKAGKLGYLTPIVKDRFFLTESIYAYARLIKEMAGEEGKVAVNELRDKLNFGRKLTVQLMEYFDRTGFLRRKGNDHILRDKDTFDL